MNKIVTKKIPIKLRTRLIFSLIWETTCCDRATTLFLCWMAWGRLPAPPSENPKGSCANIFVCASTNKNNPPTASEAPVGDLSSSVQLETQTVQHTSSPLSSCFNLSNYACRYHSVLKPQALHIAITYRN